MIAEDRGTCVERQGLTPEMTKMVDRFEQILRAPEPTAVERERLKNAWVSLFLLGEPEWAQAQKASGNLDMMQGVPNQ